MACLPQNNQPLGVAGSEDPYIKSAWGDTRLVAWGFRARYEKRRSGLIPGKSKSYGKHHMCLVNFLPISQH